MKIKFQGTAQDIAQIEEGTCLMLQDPVLHSCLSGKDSMTAELKVTFTDAPDLTVKRTGTQAEITCQKPSHYYRGLTWLLHNLDQETYEKRETAYFPRNGLMLPQQRLHCGESEIHDPHPGTHGNECADALHRGHLRGKRRTVFRSLQRQIQRSGNP